MRIVVITAGSRGDVAPFTGLGQRLRDAGHQVTVAAHPSFAPLVEGCGLRYRALPGDPRELIRTRARAASPEEAGRVMAEFLDGLADGVLAAAADGAEAVLTAFGPSGLSRAAGEALGVPVLGTYLAPAFATREFALPGAGEAGRYGPEDCFAAGRAVLRRADSVAAGAVTRLRRRLGLPPDAPRASARPTSHGFSPLVVPRPADWPPGVDVVGYWWPARPQGWRPPAELVDFLQAGPPPVFVGFGSMAPGEGERLRDLVAAAVRRAGVRAVVQAGWAGLTGAGDDLLTIGDLPHDWLFPRTGAVVHHAGAGTAGAALRAGVPSVPVPVLADQPFWAARLHRLGAASPPIPFQHLGAENLASAITAARSGPVSRRAAAIAGRLAAEDGAAGVLARIDAGLDR